MQAGLSQALNDVFEDNQGNSRTSLTRQLEKIRRAEQVGSVILRKGLMHKCNCARRVALPVHIMSFISGPCAFKWDMHAISEAVQHVQDISCKHAGARHLCLLASLHLQSITHHKLPSLPCVTCAQSYHQRNEIVNTP